MADLSADSSSTPGVRSGFVGPLPAAAGSPSHRRSRAAGQITGLFGALAHLALLGLFAALGAWPLVWFNVGSIAVWVAIGWLHSRRHTKAALALGLAELVSHALFATFVLGWASGFHLAIPVATPLYLGRKLRRLGPLTAVAVWGVSFAVLRERPPLVPLAPSVLNLIAFGVALAAFVILGLTLTSIARAADTAEAALDREHLRSEQLVHNMLPAEIANRLKGGESNIADRVDEASVLFADLVGFTAMSARVKPSELVVILSDLFSRFDALAEKHQLEKIKTIGDAYMVASGVPRPRADHVKALADFALDLVELIDGLEPVYGTKLKMRIGINSGVVIAGVIGRAKLAYDMWGDTVNTAARMESHGAEGRIHVTQAVRDRLGAGFEFESRGVIEVKGKGPMQTFFLRARVPEHPSEKKNR